MAAEKIQNRVNDKFPNLESEAARAQFSTPTSPDSTDEPTQACIFSPEDSPASLFPSPGSSAARTITVTSGRKCAELLTRQDPVGSLVRMLLESSRWNSTLCFLTWKISATPRSRLLFRLVPSMPNTDGTEFGFWPTPTACDHKGAGPTNIRKDGKNRTNDRLDYATEFAPGSLSKSGSLNPAWVEWLMGYPIGHTDSRHWATRLSRKSPTKSCAASRKSKHAEAVDAAKTS